MKINVEKTTKIVAMIILAIMVVAVASTVFAAVNPSGYTGNSSVDTQKIDNLGNTIIKIVSTVGSIASVIVLVVLGIKYMMGSAEEKAEYKKTLLPYVIGAALVFAASAIAGVVYNFASSTIA